MTEYECPKCPREPDAVVDVQAIGTAGPREQDGTVHAEPVSNGWRLYIHTHDE